MLCAQRDVWKAAWQGDGVGPGEPSLSPGVTAHTLLLTTCHFRSLALFACLGTGADCTHTGSGEAPAE